MEIKPPHDSLNPVVFDESGQMAAILKREREGRVLRLIMNRPDRRNALNIALCRELLTALSDAANDAEVGAILLSGSGPVFCSGLDVEEVSTAKLDLLLPLHSDLFSIRLRMTKPLIAAVHGVAFGSGLGLALNCHFVITSTDAKLGLTEIRLGIWPYLIYRIVAAAVGDRRATQLAMLGKAIDAHEALRLGLVDEVIPSEDLAGKAFGLAHQLSQLSSRALSDGLEFANAVREAPQATAIKMAAHMRTRAEASPDFREGVRAFLESRSPQWGNTCTESKSTNTFATVMDKKSGQSRSLKKENAGLMEV